MKNKIIATIEARMTSSRLPGKVMLLVHGKPMLQHLVDRLKKVTLLDDIVLATTVNNEDDILEEFANKVGISCFRGSEDDVMGRVIGAASLVQADIVVEITGDCPIIDPQIIEQAINIYIVNDADYVSNSHIRSYPDGMDVQIFALAILKHSASMTSLPLDREHVTLHIRNNPDIFKHLHLFAPPELYWPELGLTLDEDADYTLLKNIIEHFGKNGKMNFTCRDVVEFLHDRADLVAINSSVIRKGDT